MHPLSRKLNLSIALKAREGIDTMLYKDTEFMVSTCLAVLQIRVPTMLTKLPQVQ